MEDGDEEMLKYFFNVDFDSHVAVVDCGIWWLGCALIFSHDAISFFKQLTKLIQSQDISLIIWSILKHSSTVRHLSLLIGRNGLYKSSHILEYHMGVMWPTLFLRRRCVIFMLWVEAIVPTPWFWDIHLLYCWMWFIWKCFEIMLEFKPRALKDVGFRCNDLIEFGWNEHEYLKTIKYNTEKKVEDSFKLV